MSDTTTEAGTTETALLGERTWVLNLPPQEARVLVSGFQSWSEAELRPLTDVQVRTSVTAFLEHGHDPAFPPSGEAGVWRSHGFVAVLRPDGSGWVAAAGDGARSFTTFEVRAEGPQVWLTARVEGPDTPVTFMQTADVAGALERRAAELGRAMGARTPAPLRVWSSWYSYFRAVTLQDMLENARLAKSHDLPFDVFQLDDGFQADLGDWTLPSAHFGGHARDLPAQLSALGFRAGLWLAPFLVGPQSQLFAGHRDWLLHGEDGEPLPMGDNWGGPFYALDTTQEAVQDWLRGLASTLRGWGYDYLKVDFLFGSALPGGRARTDLSRAEAYRLGLQAVREGAGDGTFILGCGAPLTASVGLVDAMRTGPDVAPFWDDPTRRLTLGDAASPSARNALYTALARWYQHPLYQPDPDVAVVRREQSLLNAHERGAVLGLLDVIGGLRASSDPISLLDERGLTDLRRALQISTPDRPRSLARTAQDFGGSVTHFTRGIFNLSDAAVDGIPAHGYREG